MNGKQVSIGLSVILFCLLYYSNFIDDVAQIKQSFLCDNNTTFLCDTEETRENISEKWIVITSVSLPTEDVKRMVKLQDWQVVVVADKKTPKEWFLEGCIFLSLETQKHLHYEISRVLPYQSYTRKMIGYLYAIQHGAKYIYDTDDDNLPIDSGLTGFVYSDVTSGLVLQSSHNSSENETAFYNVYSHFGRSDVWPRGFPLDKINDNIDVNYKLCEEVKTPAIQQGLVNQDADVDAIYRLLYIKNKSKGLRISFDSHAPPIILPKKIYCPFNSQNTLFHYEAFWALMLPTTVTFRVTDIWRGYWAQRLLHLTDKRLGFYPPNVRQSRNPHNYLKDFSEEDQLYTDTTKLVQAIEKWQCKSEKFSNCVTELSEFMATNDFWGTDDLKLTKAWIKDLTNIGYKFPEKGQVERPGDCRNANFISPIHKSFETCAFDRFLKVASFCDPFVNETVSENSKPVTFNHTKNVVLNIVFNSKNYIHIPMLQQLYQPFFANVVFCGNFVQDFAKVAENSSVFRSFWNEQYSGFSYVNVSKKEIEGGIYHYICLSKVAQMQFQNIDGYFVVADDMVINFWHPYPTDKVVFTKDCTTPGNASHHFRGWYGLPALTKLHEFITNNSNSLLQTMTQNNMLINQLVEIVLEPMHCISDIYYIPVSLIPKYQFLADLFQKYSVFVEVAVPKILYLLGWAQNDTLELDEVHKSAKPDTMFKGRYLWNYGPSRGDVYSFNYYNDKDTFLHPVKWSFANKTEWRNVLCVKYVTKWFENTISGDEEN